MPSICIIKVHNTKYCTLSVIIISRCPYIDIASLIIVIAYIIFLQDAYEKAIAFPGKGLWHLQG